MRFAFSVLLFRLFLRPARGFFSPRSLRSPRFKSSTPSIKERAVHLKRRERSERGEDTTIASWMAARLLCASVVGGNRISPSENAILTGVYHGPSSFPSRRFFVRACFSASRLLR